MAASPKDWLPNYTVHQRRRSKTSVAIECCHRVPEDVSAVWVEVRNDGFAARGRVLGEGEVSIVSPATRHYSIALSRAEAWAATYSIPVVHVVTIEERDARLLLLSELGAGID